MYMLLEPWFSDDVFAFGCNRHPDVSYTTEYDTTEGAEPAALTGSTDAASVVSTRQRNGRGW